MFPQFNAPILVGGDTYIYYTGWRYGHTAWSQSKVLQEEKRDLRSSAVVMLAVMPEDHWVSLNAGAKAGTLLAGPFRQLPYRLFINADAINGSIEIEFVDGYEQPLPGFSQVDSVPIIANGKNQEVLWNGTRIPIRPKATIGAG